MKVMIAKYRFGNVTWVDLECPSAAEIREITREYSLHPAVADELTRPTLKPKVDSYDNFVYLILNFPALRSPQKKEPGESAEIDFVVGREFLITARYESIDALHRFAKTLEVSDMLGRSFPDRHAGHLFALLVTALYENLLHELEFAKDALHRIETQIFAGREREMVIRLSAVSRHLLDFRRATSFHEEMLASFASAGQTLFGGGFGNTLRPLMSECLRVESGIRGNMEILSELRATNDSLLSTRQNEQVKTLSTIAFIALPLSIVVSLFQIDARSRPLIGAPNDFWILLALLAGIGLALLLVFKWKKWL